MKKVYFRKFHCLGNDFLVIDLIANRYRAIDFGRLAAKICSRNEGVGADGILVVHPARKADCYLDIYNSDGSWAEKSGNGLRITAAFMAVNYTVRKKIVIQTKMGNSEARIIKSGKTSSKVMVSLGKPLFEADKVPIRTRSKYHINRPIKVENREFTLTALSVGNPHAVIFVDSFDFDWRFLGSILETSKAFPNRTNVEFAMIVNRSKVLLNDWERGAGATGSSGTGAGATVAAGVINGYLNRKAEVVFPLGSLFIDWSDEDDNLYLTGPVKLVCNGEYLY